MNIVNGKIVTVSKPYFTEEGNTWIADAVYCNGDKYYTRKVLSPTVQTGPFAVGDLVEMEADEMDSLAEQWLIEIYRHPESYKEIMNIRKKEEEEENGKSFSDATPKEKAVLIIKLVISILLVVAFGFVLKTMIAG